MAAQLSNKYQGTTRLHIGGVGNSSSAYAMSPAVIGASNRAYAQGLQTSTEYCLSKCKSHHKAVRQLFIILCCTHIAPSALRHAEISVCPGSRSKDCSYQVISAAPGAARIWARKSRKKGSFWLLCLLTFPITSFLPCHSLKIYYFTTMSIPPFFFQSRKNKEPSFTCTS